LHIANAESASEDDTLILDQRDRRAGHAEGLQRGPDVGDKSLDNLDGSETLLVCRRARSGEIDKAANQRAG
jgi:hypothetical protein